MTISNRHLALKSGMGRVVESSPSQSVGGESQVEARQQEPFRDSTF